VVGLGLLVMNVFFDNAHELMLQVVAFASALLASVLFRLLELKLPHRQEAVIGVIYVLAASLAILVLAGHPHSGEQIQYLLSGQILFTTWQDVLIIVPWYTLLFAIWVVRPNWREGFGFYVFFALFVTLAVQYVGVFVIFASLIIPALCAEWINNESRAAVLIGVLGISGGIVSSAISDLPAGPLIVMVYFFVLCFVFFTKRKSIY
jgi:zinc/manganese transport system permease protein